MPHNYALMRVDKSDEMLEKRFASVGMFEQAMAQATADTFNNLLGEDLKVGTTSIAHTTVFTSSCPMDLAVIIAAWWTPQRAQRVREICGSIQQTISDFWGGEYSVEVHLNIIGTPGFPSSTRLVGTSDWDMHTG